jgi:hypothetical protein
VKFEYHGRFCSIYDQVALWWCVCRDILWVHRRMTFLHPTCGPPHLWLLGRSRSMFDWVERINTQRKGKRNDEIQIIRLAMKWSRKRAFACVDHATCNLMTSCMHPMLMENSLLEMYYNWVIVSYLAVLPEHNYLDIRFCSVGGGYCSTFRLHLFEAIIVRLISTRSSPTARRALWLVPWSGVPNPYGWWAPVASAI